jgi:hypothetical protein
MSGLVSMAVLYLVAGALIIGVGGVVSTFGIDTLKEKRRVRGWVWVTFGALVIGCGSFLTGQGLDYRATRLHKQALIIAVAQEWELNNQEFLDSKLLQGDTAAFRNRGTLYPRFSRDAAIAALTSGLFDRVQERDSVFLSTIAEVSFMVRDINARLDLSDWLTLQPEVGDSLVALHRKHLRESVRFKWFLETHLLVDSVLHADYAWLQQYRGLAVTSHDAGSSAKQQR